MMIATTGATMLGGMISQKAGTNNKMAALGGGLSGAGMGASMGAAFGPWGMLAGAVGGGLLGAISGWRNADKLRKENKDKSIAAVRDQITGNRTFNRLSDFSAARTDAATTRTELSNISAFGEGGLQKRIDELKVKKEEAKWGDLVMGQLPSIVESFVNFAGKAGLTPYTVQSTGIDENGNGFTQNVLSGFQDKTGKTFDYENNMVEDRAREFAKTIGFSAEAIDKAFNGKGGAQDAIGGLQYLSNLKYDGDIAELTKQLDTLKEKYPDVGAATEEYKLELGRLADKQAAFVTSSSKASLVLDGTGVSMNEVADLFDKLGLSLSETSIGINEFNTLIGMTGDIAADRANGAGRFGRSLLAKTQQDMALADSESRLAQQLQTMFATKGNIGSLEGTRVAGETLNEVVGNSVAALSAGTVDWKTLVGEQGQNGQLQNQLITMVMNAGKGGVSKDVIDALMTQIFGPNGITTQVEAAKTDPFARAQFDATFNEGLTNQMDSAVVALTNKIKPGMTKAQVDAILAGGEDELVKWLEGQGMTVDDATKAKLDTMLQSSFLNSSTAISNALYQGGQFVADAIRSALTGSPMPVKNPYAGFTPNQQNPGNPFTVGDTTTSRFARTMSSHGKLDSMVPGKRTVTSGLRNTMLGSIGSDHSTGAAYDLVGDNLVSYANNVKTAGGFAEFHGGTADKHLHVVPPVGDTSSPRSGGYASGGSTNHYNFEINGGDGANAQEIADAVMERIARAERNRRERS
jgi:hypothetical protein